jgi:ankyrin repeat protein
MTLPEAIRAGDDAAFEATLAADPLAVHAADEHGVSALLWAVYVHRKDWVDRLISLGARPDFFAACAMGDSLRAGEFVNADPSVLFAHSPDGWTGLHLAAYFGHDTLAADLLARGADPRLRSVNSLENLPIHAAAAGRHASLVGILLEARSPVDARQTGGFTPLHSAARNGDQATIAVLEAAGANWDARDDQGQTPRDLLHPRSEQRDTL